MRNLKFMRCGSVLLGLVVLCTKAQNGFCPMCTKERYMVSNRSKLFWGQFWGQIYETDSRPHRSNKCAVLVSLRIWDTNLTRRSRRKSPTNQYISFTLNQEVVRTPLLHALPAHRPCHREKRPCLGTFSPHRRGARPAKYRPHSPLSGSFWFYQNGIFLCRFCLYRKIPHK